MEALNKLVGNGGSYYYNSTTAYTVAGTKSRVHAIQVLASCTLESLEDEDGDCLAKYGLANGTALSFGMLITSRRDKPFTKIKFSAAGAVMFYREG